MVYSKPPFGGPEYVLHYLGRYTHRVAISNHRLVSFADGQVTFRWRDSAHNHEQKLMSQKLMSLHGMSSCAASSCTCYPKASSASATLASSLIADAPLYCRFDCNYSAQYHRRRLNQKRPLG